MRDLLIVKDRLNEEKSKLEKNQKLKIRKQKLLNIPNGETSRILFI